MTEQPPPAQTVDVIATIRQLRQSSLIGPSSGEVLERVREYEKSRLQPIPESSPVWTACRSWTD